MQAPRIRLAENATACPRRLRPRRAAAAGRPRRRHRAPLRRSTFRTRSRAPHARHARSAYHSATTCSARSSAAVSTRRRARLIRSVHSVSIRLRSLRGYSSSSSSARASSSAAIASPRERTAASSSDHGRVRAISPAMRRAREPLGRGAQRLPLGAGQLAGPLAVAEREPRARERGVAPFAERLERRRGLPHRRRVEPDQLAARDDRRQHLGEPVGQQDQVHERRRLLERLQHPVGGLVAELVDALDHEHAATRLERRLARRRHDRAVDVADEDLVRAARRDPGQIGMGARRDPALARSRDPATRRRAARPRSRGPRTACRRRPARGTGTRATRGRPPRAPARARRGRGGGAPALRASPDRSAR